MKSMLKETFIIAIITIIAGLCLGVVYDLTKDRIAKQNLLTEQEAYKKVFSEAASFSEIEATGWTDKNTDLDKLLGAYNETNELLGYVMVLTNHEGYNGDITFSLGITLQNEVHGISIIEIKETPGLGMEANKILVPQFKNTSASEFTVVKQKPQYDNQIQAISSATFTTNAITNGVNTGLSYYNKVLGGVQNE